MNLVLYFGLALHFLSIGGLVIFGLHRLWMMVCWLIRRQKAIEHVGELKAVPVTIQIPLYNESAVAARIIDAVANIRWPSHLKEIQILDDSTDQTCRIVDERASFWKTRGIAIHVIRRSERQGYKAGALANGLRSAKGKFIAVFDGDFIPYPDFLEKTLPYFSDSSVGMVQARWKFLNRSYSWLTRIQGLLLASHFRVEHFLRFSRALFFNFNGTAGIWRKQAIIDSGGWQSDTVTEDLDLSYRAQVSGWRFVYVDSVTVPSELPVTLSAFRRQQQRWSKGSIQTARKMLPVIFRSQLPFSVKLEAAAHLLANLCWLFGWVSTLTIYPLIWYRSGIGPYQMLMIDLPVIIFSSGIFWIYYLLFAIFDNQTKRIWLIFFLPAFSIGLSLPLALAVLSGIFTNGGQFVRTPKFGITETKDSKVPIVLESTFYPVINFLLIGYTLLPVVFAYHHATWPAIPFLLQFPFGFLMIMGQELADTIRFSRRNVGWFKKANPH